MNTSRILFYPIIIDGTSKTYIKTSSNGNLTSRDLYSLSDKISLHCHERKSLT